MNQIRHFFRYEIPGYLSFIYIFIIVVSTLKKSIIVAYIIPNLHSILFAGFLIALPIGWIIYQIYAPFRFKELKGLNCHPETLEKVKRWFGNKYDINLDEYLTVQSEKKSKKEKEKIKEIYYQQLIDIGIYSNGNKFSNSFELLINNLSNKYNSYDSRYIVGFWVPIFSAAFLFIYFLFSIICKFEFFIFDSISRCLNSYRFWIIIVFVIIIVVISIVIYLHKKAIYYAIQAQEDFLITIKKHKIEQAFETLLDKDLAKKE